MDSASVMMLGKLIFMVFDVKDFCSALLQSVKGSAAAMRYTLMVDNLRFGPNMLSPSIRLMVKHPSKKMFAFVRM